MKRPKINFSDQATAIISQVRDFDLADFESYFFREGYPIGSRNITEYLMFRAEVERQRKEKKK